MVRFCKFFSLIGFSLWSSTYFVGGAGVPIPNANAAGQATGSVEIVGEVPVLCGVEVRDVNGTLDLVSGETGKRVATVIETCNIATGYAVTISSRHSGALQSVAGDRAPYRITYSDISAAPLAEPVTLSRNEARFDYYAPVIITIPANRFLPAGAYSDAITIAVSAY